MDFIRYETFFYAFSSVLDIVELYSRSSYLGTRDRMEAEEENCKDDSGGFDFLHKWMNWGLPEGWLVDCHLLVADGLDRLMLALGARDFLWR